MINCRSAALWGLRQRGRSRPGGSKCLRRSRRSGSRGRATVSRVTAQGAGGTLTLLVDRIVVATGFRPDLGMLRELRVDLDPAVEAPPALAPLIDPNLHSCGTVPPHGAAELAHPEPGFFIVGAKSYGRAPTFLMATGYEQVRSVVAEIAGDHAAAREVRLVLPETGVCSAGPGRRGGDRLLRRSRAGGCGGLLCRRCRGEGCGPKWLRLRRVPGARRSDRRVTVGTTDLDAAGLRTVAERRRVVAALGIVQILAWGSSYYLLAVLAGPIARDTGWPYAWVIGGVSLGLLVAGLASVRVGRAIEECGGRRVLAAAAVLLAAGLALMAAAPSWRST